MNGRPANEEEYGQGMTQGANRDSKTEKLNYLQFKDFMINFGLLTREQAQTNCVENLLIFDIWEIIAPKVERDLTGIDKEDESLADDHDLTQTEDVGIDSRERNYRKELRSMEVNLEDVRVMLMAITRLNDGKTFIENELAPLPQSEGEIGFRDEKSGLIFLRNDELPKI